MVRWALIGALLAAPLGGLVPSDVGVAAPSRAVDTPRDTILQLTNLARVRSGAPLLRLDEGLSAVAQAYAEDMGRRGYFGHKTPEGHTFVDRLRDRGFTVRAAGENLAGNLSAAAAVESWLDSTGHRRNMLDPAYGRLGVGVYRDPAGPHTYYVQLFAD